MTDPTVTIEAIKPSKLIVDERAQRALSEGKVGKLVGSLNLKAIGVPILSQRDDGKTVIIDGQHRVIALIRAGLGDTPIQCQVHHGLALADEAALFLRYNDRHIVQTLERFRIGVTAQIPECVKLDNIIVHNGFRAALTHKNGLTCVETLRKVYRRGAEKGQDGRADVVDATLRIISDAWGTEGTATREAVAGIGGVVGRYNGELDRERLKKKLALISGGPNGLRARARTLYDIGRARSITDGAEMAVVDIYNDGLRGNGKLA